MKQEIKNLLSISLNLAIRAAALNVALYLANSFATKYGSNYIAAQTIAFQIWLFFAFFIDGYSSVGNIVSGKLLGEQNFKKLWRLSVKLSKYSIVVAFILVFICGIFYFQIGKLFSLISHFNLSNNQYYKLSTLQKRRKIIDEYRL